MVTKNPNKASASHTIISSTVDLFRVGDVSSTEFIEFFLAMFTLQCILFFINILFWASRAHCRPMVIDCRLVFFTEGWHEAICMQKYLWNLHLQIKMWECYQSIFMQLERKYSDHKLDVSGFFCAAPKSNDLFGIYWNKLNLMVHFIDQISKYFRPKSVSRIVCNPLHTLQH